MEPSGEGHQSDCWRSPPLGRRRGSVWGFPARKAARKAARKLFLARLLSVVVSSLDRNALLAVIAMRKPLIAQRQLQRPYGPIRCWRCDKLEVGDRRRKVVELIGSTLISVETLPASAGRHVDIFYSTAVLLGDEAR